MPKAGIPSPSCVRRFGSGGPGRGPHLLGGPKAGGKGPKDRRRHPGRSGPFPPRPDSGRKTSGKARKAGFDWDSAGPALDKLSEETEELRAAVRDGTNPEEELGDLLFAAVKAGRFLGLDSEQALHAACEKFIRRFRRVEELSDKPLPQQDVSALEALWRRAKAEEVPSAT